MESFVDPQFRLCSGLCQYLAECGAMAFGVLVGNEQVSQCGGIKNSQTARKTSRSTCIVHLHALASFTTAS